MTDTTRAVLPDVTPDGVPVSPTVSLSDAVPSDTDLAALLTAFRLLQVQHARVLQHESVSRGLNATDTRFVFFLAAADGDGVTPKQAGEYLELTTGAMTSLIDRLEQRGHLERRPNPQDRRSVLLHLTASGAEVSRQIGAVYSDAFRQAVAPVERLRLAASFEGLGDALARRSGTESADRPA